MMTLTEIFDYYKTDKGSIGHGSEIHNYGLVYQDFFEPLRTTPISLLEIGVLTGNSLRSWRDYFENGDIFGVDNDPICIFQEHRIQTKLADQSNPQTIVDAFDGREYDIIIDDGSHESIHQQQTLKELFKYVKPGGYYIIEDLHCPYLNHPTRWGKTQIGNRFDTTYEMLVNQFDMSYYIDSYSFDIIKESIDNYWYNQKVVVIKKKELL